MSAKAFKTAVRQFQRTSERRVLDAFVFSTEEVARSIKFGSALTGAPGQPVQTANLLSSWIGNFIDRNNWEFVATGLAKNGEEVGYARYIEEGVNPSTGEPLVLRSQVGGFHSVKLKRAGWDMIVEFARRKAAGYVA